MNFNENKNNKPFDNEFAKSIWILADEKLYFNPNNEKFDKCGALIKLEDYGNTESDYGWEIDHIHPKDKKESYHGNDIDDITNLQPLHWKNNRSKGNDYPEWYSAVTYNEELKKNVEQKQYMNEIF